MATINYNGIELQSITECKVFEEPQEMLVWNTSYNGPIEKMVCAIIPYRHEGSVITRGGIVLKFPKSPHHAGLRIESWRSGWRRGTGSCPKKAVQNLQLHGSINLVIWTKLYQNSLVSASGTIPSGMNRP